MTEREAQNVGMFIYNPNPTAGDPAALDFPVVSATSPSADDPPATAYLAQNPALVAVALLVAVLLLKGK